MLHLQCYNSLPQSLNQRRNIESLRNPFPKCHCRTNPPSPFIQYLQKSCGISPKHALKASKSLKLIDPETATMNVESVLLFLKSQGFSETQIRSLLSSIPQILNYSAPDSRISPSIEFFREKGLSQPEVVDLMVANPVLLVSSLEEWTKPNFDIVKSIFGTDELAIEWLRRRKVISLDRLVVNATTLKHYGIPNHTLAKFLARDWIALQLNPNRFEESVKMVKEMGFDPSTYTFLEAVRVKASLSYKRWEMKFSVYKSYGWSDEQILSAFRREPLCMLKSEEKIRKVIDFFVKEVGWDATYVSVYPNLIKVSLEKRIIRRHMFLKVLVSKGLISTDKNAYRFIMTDQMFLEKYVMKYQEKFPEVLEVYENFSGLKVRD